MIQWKDKRFYNYVIDYTIIQNLVVYDNRVLLEICSNCRFGRGYSLPVTPFEIQYSIPKDSNKNFTQ